MQKKRLKGLHDNPDTAWRVSDEELATVKDYDEIYARYDELLRNTDFDFARWTMVNGEDKRSANITIAKALVRAPGARACERPRCRRRSRCCEGCRQQRWCP